MVAVLEAASRSLANGGIRVPVDLPAVAGARFTKHDVIRGKPLNGDRDQGRVDAMSPREDRAALVGTGAAST